MSVDRFTVMRSVIAIALLAAVVVFAELPHTTKFMHVLHKAGHPVVFGAIALLLLSLLGNRANGKREYCWRHYFSAFGMTIAIGAATEIAQQFTHRDSSIVDVLSDATGAAACLALHAGWFGATSVAREPKVRIACWTLGLLATLTAAAPMTWCLVAYAWRDVQFPVIAQYRSAPDTYFISAEAGNTSTALLPAKWAGANDEKAFRIAISNGSYPGISVTEPYPRWRGFTSLMLDITNPGKSPLALVVRVHDRKHNNAYDDRFNRDVTIDAETRVTLAIPIGEIARLPANRLLDLDTVAGLIIFAAKPVPQGEFFVSRVWLQ